jgi:hypothetical protein
MAWADAYGSVAGFRLLHLESVDVGIGAPRNAREPYGDKGRTTSL